MKHAGDQALDVLQPLLAEVRALPGLQEKKRGTFYRCAAAFLHFHEDPAGFFADLKVAGEFQRFSVNTRSERQTFLTAAKAASSSNPKASRPLTQKR